MQIVKSLAGVPIRLTPERTEHIERRHPEMSGESDRILETLSSPDYVQEGDSGTLIAILLPDLPTGGTLYGSGKIV